MHKTWPFHCALALAGALPLPAWAASSLPPVAATASTPLHSGIRAYGDSLMAGAVATYGITVPSQLALDLGIPVANYGIGGQVSTHIAMRMGGVTPLLTLSGNAIAATYNTAITAINGTAPAGMATAQSPDYRFLQTAADNNTRTTYGTLCGIHGAIQSRNNAGGPPSTATGWYFFPDVTSISTPCPANSPWLDDLYAQAKNPTIIEEGRNNYSATAQVESDIAASVASVDPSAYLVFGILKGEYSTEYPGQTGATQVATINANSASLYGAHYFDWQAFLQTQYNPANIMDLADVANGVTPFSLRGVAQTTTLSGALGTTGCPTTAAALLTGTMQVDSEYIDIAAVSGTTATSCTRGQGQGGAAASHSSGATVTVTDRVHLGTGYKLTADYIASTPALKAALLGKYAYQVASPASDWSSHAAPAWFQHNIYGDGIYAAHGFVATGNNTLSVCLLSAYDSSQNLACGVSFTNGTIGLGGGYVTKACLGTGGSGGANAQCSQNDGDFSNSRSFLHQGYSYAQPATGTTVTMADTTEIAIIEPAATLAALTIQLPTCSATYDGKQATYTSTQTITALTVTATAGTVIGAPTTLSPPGNAYQCRGSTAKWYRLQ